MHTVAGHAPGTDPTGPVMTLNAMRPHRLLPRARAALSAWVPVLAILGVVTGAGAQTAPPSQAAVAPAGLPGEVVQDKKDFSPAERALFMGNAMKRLKAPATLQYSFRKSGALEEGFEDKVVLRYLKPAKGACCTVSGQFLSGQRKVELPDVEEAEANPVLLYFLEHDVREMKRITKGSPNYYRKRIRLAAYESARLSEVTLSYRGQPLKGQQIELLPYDNDPARARFEKFARKSYVFLMTDGVPGGVFGVRTVMRGETDGAPPMVIEEMYIDGADVPKSSN